MIFFLHQFLNLFSLLHDVAVQNIDKLFDGGFESQHLPDQFPRTPPTAHAQHRSELPTSLSREGISGKAGPPPDQGGDGARPQVRIVARAVRAHVGEAEKTGRSGHVTQRRKPFLDVAVHFHGPINGRRRGGGGGGRRKILARVKPLIGHGAGDLQLRIVGGKKVPREPKLFRRAPPDLERFPRRFVAGERCQDPFVAQEELHEGGGNFREISAAACARHVLVLWTPQHRVQGMAHLVEKGFHGVPSQQDRRGGGLRRKWRRVVLCCSIA